MLTARGDEADRIAQLKGEAHDYVPRLSIAGELVVGGIKGKRVRTKTVVVTLLLLMLLTGAIAAVIHLQKQRQINMSHLAPAQTIAL